MRIIQQKNLAYEDQPKPMLAHEAAETLKPRPPKKPLEAFSTDLDLFLPSAERPRITVDQGKTGANRIRLTIENLTPGRHVFPPAIPRKDVKTLGDRSAAQRPCTSRGSSPTTSASARRRRRCRASWSSRRS